MRAVQVETLASWSRAKAAPRVDMFSDMVVKAVERAAVFWAGWSDKGM